MGNYVSCALSSTHFGKSSTRAAAKVIFPSGEIKRFEEPIKAAELMLETPNHFVVNTRSLKLGRRFSPLHADEDLEFAGVYVMIPMNKANRYHVTAADMGALLVAANSASKKGFGGRKVLPEAANDEDESASMVQPKLDLDDIEEFSSQEFMQRVSISRSKKPLLETIAEETICAR